MKKIVLGVACAAALFAAAADAAPSPHEAVRRQLADLRAKPEKAELPPYLAPDADFDDACQRAKKEGKLVFVSSGREACGRCQVFYEYVKRGELKIDDRKFVFIRLSIDDESQRSYFLSTFSPMDRHLPYVGVMDGDREEKAPCLSGGHTVAEYAALLTRAAAPEK